MPKSETFTKAHNLLRLQEELETAIPALIRTQAGAREALYTLSSRGEEILLTIPETVERATLQAVLDAHDPARRTAAQQAQAAQQTERRDLRDFLAAAATHWDEFSAEERDTAIRGALQVAADLLTRELGD